MWVTAVIRILFSEIGFCMASCSYIYIYIYNYIYIIYIYIYIICQDGGAVGFVEFTKLLLALSSLAQPLKRVRSIPEHFFVILSQRKVCAGRFRKETAGKRTGPITRWPLRRLLFTRLEIVFVTISSFTSCSESVSRRLMLLISFKKSCLWVTAPNVTEAKRPFYERFQR